MPPFLPPQALYKSVKLVQKLRSAVSLTFQHLADGVKRVTPNEAVDVSNGSHVTSSEVTSVDGIPNAPTINDDEKVLVEELKKNLKKVNYVMRCVAMSRSNNRRRELKLPQVLTLPVLYVYVFCQRWAIR